jgi:hypothetical protein
MESKRVLKIAVGSLLIFSKLIAPQPIFYSWSRSEELGANIATMGIFVLALWLIYSGARGSRAH